MKKLNKLVSAVALSASISCAGMFSMTREERGVEYTIDEPQITKEFKGKSDYSVLLMPEEHKTYGCQANFYLTLENLLDDIKFVARESRSGETKHNFGDLQTMRYFDGDLNEHFYKEFIDLPFEERKEKASKWIKNKKYPSLRTVEKDWAYADPMLGEILFECVYQENVKTIGVEDKEVYEKVKSKTIWKHPTYEQLKNLFEKNPELRELVFDKREEKMVENIDKFSSEIKKGNVVPFAVGFRHIPGLTKRFEDKSISYKVLEFKSCYIGK